MIFDFLRLTYAKVMQIWNGYETEMREWAQKEPEAFTYYIHYCQFMQEGT